MIWWYGDEAWVTELLADLSTSSPEFRAWWPEHEILLTCNSAGEIYHPLVGHLAFQITTLTVPQQPDWGMVVYTPLSQTDTLHLLCSLDEPTQRWKQRLSKRRERILDTRGHRWVDRTCHKAVLL